MANAGRNSFSLQEVEQTASSLIQRDRIAQERNQRDRDERLVLPIDRIQDRPESTRSINDGHAKALLESISALGLLEPIVVDLKGRLLAGGHRLAAIRELQRSAPEHFDKHFSAGVPVRLMPFDAEAEPEKALDVEVAENEFRRDYTREEIKQLVERLRGAGYRETVGRPKEGQKALGPALQVIIHKSLRTVRRIVAEVDGEEAEAKRPTETAREKAARLSIKRTLGVKASVKEKKSGLMIQLELSGFDELEDLLKKVSRRR